MNSNSIGAATTFSTAVTNSSANTLPAQKSSFAFIVANDLAATEKLAVTELLKQRDNDQDVASIVIYGLAENKSNVTDVRIFLNL